MSRFTLALLFAAPVIAFADDHPLVPTVKSEIPEKLEFPVMVFACPTTLPSVTYGRNVEATSTAKTPEAKEKPKKKK